MFFSEKMVTGISSSYTPGIYAQGYIVFYTPGIYAQGYIVFYTPGIYAQGYIVFALTFVRSSVRMFIRSLVRSFVTFRHVRRIYHKVFG